MFLGTKYHALLSACIVFIGEDVDKCDGVKLRDSAGTRLQQGKTEKAIFFTARKRKLKKFFRIFPFMYLFIHLTNVIDGLICVRHCC